MNLYFYFVQKRQNTWERPKCQQGSSSHASCYHGSNMGHRGRIVSHARFPWRDSPAASGRVSAMSFARVQTSCNLVCDSREVPAAKTPMQTVQPCCRESQMVTWGPAWAEEHSAASSLCPLPARSDTLQCHLWQRGWCIPNANVPNKLAGRL